MALTLRTSPSKVTDGPPLEWPRGFIAYPSCTRTFLEHGEQFFQLHQKHEFCCYLASWKDIWCITIPSQLLGEYGERSKTYYWHPYLLSIEHLGHIKCRYVSCRTASTPSHAVLMCSDVFLISRHSCTRSSFVVLYALPKGIVVEW